MPEQYIDVALLVPTILQGCSFEYDDSSPLPVRAAFGHVPHVLGGYSNKMYRTRIFDVVEEVTPGHGSAQARFSRPATQSLFVS